MKTLTNEQLVQVVNKLKETRTDDFTAIEEAVENYDNSNDALEEGQGRYIDNGVIMEDDIDNDFDHFENLNIDLDKYVDNMIKDKMSKEYNLTDEETIKFINTITRIRNNENFNVYEELPETIKSQINKMVDTECGYLSPLDKKRVLSFTAKEYVKEILSDSELNSTVLDLEEAMRTLIPSPTEIYSETNRECIENEFLKVAEKIKENSPQKAQNLLNMRQGFIDAYTFENMYKSLNNSKIVKNVRRSKVLWNRTSTEYKKVAGKCKFRLYMLEDIIKSLKIIGFTEEQSRRIVTLFVYTYTDGIHDYQNAELYNDIYRNSFGNYFAMNIINLSLTPDLVSDFSKNIKNNLIELCKTIDTLIAEKEAELSNKKKKRG